MTRRTRMILIRAAVVVFLLYAVVNVVNLRTQIKSKRDELASLTLRVEEYQKANETLRQEMQSGISRGGYRRDGADRTGLCGTGRAYFCRYVQPVKGNNNGGKTAYMDLAVGAIVEGKVTGITKFGAFVALPEGKSGMVHISEVASTFVNDIKDFLQEGQQVKVKIINIDQAGRINLSIKKAQPSGAASAETGAP